MLKYIRHFFVLMLIFGIALPLHVHAADGHTIIYEYMDGTQINQEEITDGSSINLPSEPDILVWIYEDCRKVDGNFIPKNDMTIKCVRNSDVSAQGNMDGGRILWFIYNKTLYVTGNGTISVADKYNTGTKKYGFSIGTFGASYPSAMYEWQKRPMVGDEKEGGYGILDIPDGSRTVEVNVSRPIAFSGETIGAPATALMEAAPWAAHAGDIETAYFSDDIALAGNLTAYFNLNSSQIAPAAIQESRFKSLKTVYLYADTSAVTRTSGMFARCGLLENVLVRTGKQFNTGNIIETANMFYGDKRLLCDSSDSIINAWSAFDSVTDARYMFMGCESLNKPMIRGWNTAALRDATGMFAGCNRLGITCDDTSDAHYDISGWDLSNVYSTAFMFAGSKIDMDNPTGGFWGAKGDGYEVIVGNVNVDAMNLGAVQCSVYMFAQNKALTGIHMTRPLPVIEDISAMFAFCPNLQNVNMAGMQAPKLMYAVAAFYGSGAEGAVVDLSGAGIASLQDGRYLFYNTGFSSIDLNGTNPSELSDGQGMFGRSDKLTTLGSEGLSGWRLPLLEDSSYMFEADKELRAVDVSDWDMGSINDISYMFADCPKISAVDVSKWKTGNLEYMDGAFMNTGMAVFSALNWDTASLKSAYRALAGCENLEKAALKGWDCSNLENINGLFYGDKALLSLDLSGWKGMKVKDAGGMCAGCEKIQDVSFPDLIKGAALDISYMLSGCIALRSADLSAWDTTNIEYAQGLFDGDALLENLTGSADANYKNALSTGAMFRGCGSLSTSTLQSAVNHMVLSKDKDMYEMFKGCEKLTSIDLTGISFASAEDLTRILYQDGAMLENISVPANFGASAKEYRNLFHTGDAKITTFTVDSSSIPALLKGYDWPGDNRSFIRLNDAMIDHKSMSDYIFSGTSPDSVEVAVLAESTFRLKSTPLPLAYEWKKGTKKLEDRIHKISVKREEAGKYTVTAFLTDLDHAGSLSHDFSLTGADHVSSMTAEYIGAPVPVTHEYSKKDVKVTLYFNGEKESYTNLSADSFRVDSLKVNKVGDNVYTATYVDADDKTFTDEFVVPGKRVIGEIEAQYEGPVIHVGNHYDTANVTVKAYYEDDRAHKEGFEVSPSGFSSTEVTLNKKNTFEATYEDKEQKKTFKASFEVMGYIPVSSVTAEYHGPDIEAGSDYKKEDVILTIHFSDGTKDQTTKDFTLDSLHVAQAGENSYVATYVDSYGTKYTAAFTVKGIEKKEEVSSIGESAPVLDINPSGGAADGSVSASISGDIQAETSNAGRVQTGDDQNLLGWIAFAVVLIVILIGAVVYKKRLKKE